MLKRNADFLPRIHEPVVLFCVIMWVFVEGRLPNSLCTYSMYFRRQFNVSVMADLVPRFTLDMCSELGLILSIADESP